MNFENIGDYIMLNSIEQHGYIIVRSYNSDIFIRIGFDGCELERLHTDKNLNVLGVDAE